MSVQNSYSCIRLCNYNLICVLLHKMQFAFFHLVRVTLKGKQHLWIQGMEKGRSVRVSVREGQGLGWVGQVWSGLIRDSSLQS